MTTKTDITLPPLPGGYAMETAAAMRNYARTAVEADRREYWDTLKLARAIVNGARYSSSQPANFGQGETRMDAGSSTQDETGFGQPAASAEVDAWIDAANSYADKYNGDDRQDIKTDVINAFYQGAQWMRTHSQRDASTEPSESAVLLDALSGLVNVLRKRHYGRMPDEVQAAYDKAWAIVFSSPIAAPAPVSQEPVAYLACDPETGEPAWGEDCVCKDNVYSPEDTGTIGRPVVFAPVAVQPVVTDEMVTRFLGWHLPQDFAPGAGISFKPLSDPLCWPIGTDLFRDPQVRAMLEYVLQGAPVAAQAQPVVNQQLTTESNAQDDATLADTQRAIIEAAEQRGYARAKSECGRDREDAKRYTWLRDHPPKDCQGGMRVMIWWESGDWTSMSGEKLDAAIDAAWAANGADHD